jgi:hypothetical protein
VGGAEDQVILGDGDAVGFSHSLFSKDAGRNDGMTNGPLLF